jgi:serine phosphatase RsbU (regulator of sigma subunit)
VPPPPRMTGIGLFQIAMICGLGAIVMALLAVLLAAGGSDPSLERNADQMGAGLVMLLTAPEPEWWGKSHGTVDDARKLLKDFWKTLTYPEVDKRTKEAIYSHKAFVEDRNKKRLSRIRDSFDGLGKGVLQGLLINFSKTGLANQSVGARINPRSFSGKPLVGAGDVEVGGMMATGATGAGTFRARVYRRQYKDSRGLYAGAAYAILSEAALQSSKGAGAWLLLGPLLVALALVAMFVQAAKASDGLKALARDLETIGKGKLDLRVTVSTGGEVGYVQRSAERMAKNLSLIQTTGSTDLEEAIGKEEELATQIHESLRSAEPPRLPGFELESLFKPGRAIGGDYFDVVELDEHRIALLLADCSESLRGVPAAMVMAMTRAYLKAAVDGDTQPTEWLSWVNRRLSRDLKSGMAVTAMALLMDTKSGEMIVVSAGHRPLVMWREGKTALINPNGIAMGLDIGPVFDKTIEEKRFSMKKNDRVVIYTDGVISAANDAGEAYGEQRFLESIRRQGAMNSAAFVNFVAGGVDKFLDGAEQTDDLTICTLKKMK